MEEVDQDEREWRMALHITFDTSCWGDEGSPEIIKQNVIAALRDTITKMEAVNYDEVTTANGPVAWWQGTTKHPTTGEVVSYRWIGLE